MEDKNKLYRIEVLMRQNLPDIDTCGLLMTNEGYAYVKLHPVKLNAKPKTDAVEVIRCKDCKWFDANAVNVINIGYCDHNKTINHFDEFCSCAKRRVYNDE